MPIITAVPVTTPREMARGEAFVKISTWAQLKPAINKLKKDFGAQYLVCGLIRKVVVNNEVVLSTAKMRNVWVSRFSKKFFDEALPKLP
jgi:hypothetical protein